MKSILPSLQSFLGDLPIKLREIPILMGVFLLPYKFGGWRATLKHARRIAALARNIGVYFDPNFYQRNFKAFMRRNAGRIEPVAYQCLTLFTLWYALEVALLPFREQYGFFLSYETAFSLKEWYKDFLIGYVVLKTAHESEGRHGGYFVLFWTAAALGEYALSVFAPKLIHAPHRIELLMHIAVSVVIFWMIKCVGRICVHKRKKNGACVD